MKAQDWPQEKGCRHRKASKNQGGLAWEMLCFNTSWTWGRRLMGCRAGLALGSGAQPLCSHIDTYPQALGPSIIPQQHRRRLLDEFAGFSYGENRCTVRVNSKNPKGRQRAACKSSCRKAIAKNTNGKWEKALQPSRKHFCFSVCAGVSQTKGGNYCSINHLGAT